jgi:hypothetical protein
MNWSGFLYSIGVFLALAAVAAFLIINRPVRPDSPRPSPKDRAELSAGERASIFRCSNLACIRKYSAASESARARGGAGYSIARHGGGVIVGLARVKAGPVSGGQG